MSQLRPAYSIGSLGTETSVDPSKVIGPLGQLRPDEMHIRSLGTEASMDPLI